MSTQPKISREAWRSLTLYLLDYANRRFHMEKKFTPDEIKVVRRWVDVVSGLVDEVQQIGR